MIETIIKTIISVGVLVCIAILLESIREGRKFIVTHYEIEHKKLKELTTSKNMLIISDLHSTTFGVGNNLLINEINSIRPDIILVAGDMLVGKHLKSYVVGERLLLELSKDYQIYYANGNHEQRMKLGDNRFQQEFSTYKSKLESAGVIFLENTHSSIRFGEQSITFWGLEIEKNYFTKFNYKMLTSSKVEEKLGNVDVYNKPLIHNYHVLLAHNPVHVDAYVKWGADLVVSGHLHGGMIRLPYIGGIITPQLRLFPRYSGGKYHKNDTDIIVSRGLGSHTLKIRFMNIPELVVVRLKGQK